MSVPDQPVELLSCSWPRPVAQQERVWLSEPEWDAPSMTSLPEAHWQRIENEGYWAIDWRSHFRSGLAMGNPGISGEMRGFHVVFRIRVNQTGRLIFWDDDGSVIRRNDSVVHEDRSAHLLARSEIDVIEGEVLDVAQWQVVGEWIWAARIEANGSEASREIGALLPYLDSVQRRLANPDGPPLKLYTHGRAALRAAVALYSMVLNGFAPSKVLLFGEHQWPPRAREIFSATLPFAEVVSTSDVRLRIQEYGGPNLVNLADRAWFVLKTCIALLSPPPEFCLIDDDVFVLSPVDDAVHAFSTADLVFAPDTDHSREYVASWGWMHGRPPPAPIGTFNAGLYFARPIATSELIARYALRVAPYRLTPWMWEQGFIASLYANARFVELPTQRYFYPLFDGLPGGLAGYDYARNPCGFASIHFGGLDEKPSDDLVMSLLPGILGHGSGSANGLIAAVASR
jgi:hypothetical protein